MIDIGLGSDQLIDDRNVSALGGLVQHGRALLLVHNPHSV